MGNDNDGCKYYEKRSATNYICVECYTNEIYKWLSSDLTDKYIDFDAHVCRN